MTQKERQERSRAEILRAALEKFGTREYDQVSMEGICARHGISKGMMYHYYTGKDELFLLCAGDTFEQLRAYVEAESEKLTEPDAPERIKAYFMLREYFFHAYPQRTRIFETAMLRPPEHLRDRIEELREPLRQLNEAFLEKVTRSMALRPGLDRARVIRYLELAAPHYRDIALRSLAGEGSPDLHTMLEAAGEVLDLMLFGVFRLRG